MNTNYEAELSERVYTDLSEYVDQFPVYKVNLNPLYLAYSFRSVEYWPCVPCIHLYCIQPA